MHKYSVWQNADYLMSQTAVHMFNMGLQMVKEQTKPEFETGKLTSQ
jgi:hypothetical protein